MFRSLVLVFIYLIFYTSLVNGRPFLNDEDDFMDISCQEDLLGEMPPECIKYLDTSATTTTTTPTTTPNIVPDEVTVVAGWVKATIGLLSSLITIYMAIVSFFKFYQKLSLSQSFMLGLGPGRQGQAGLQETYEMPVLTSKA